MTQNILSFGERLDGFPVPVLNERAVRASAGLLFVGALVSFMNANDLPGQLDSPLRSSWLTLLYSRV